MTPGQDLINSAITLSAQERLEVLPSDLRRALTAHLNAADDRLQAETLLERKRARIAAEVTAAKGEDGKPLYTNETTRKAAIDARMETEADSLLAGVLEAKRAEDEASIVVEVTRARLRVLEAIARLGGQA